MKENEIRGELYVFGGELTKIRKKLPCRKGRGAGKRFQFYSSMTTIQWNTPSFAEKRQEPPYLSAVAVILWMPMPFR